MKKKFLTTHPSQTKKLGKILAEKILKDYHYRLEKCWVGKKAIVIGLIGDLGGGKTTFLQGLAKGLQIKEKILSPTFVIYKRFKIKDLRFKCFCHIDCYRIKKPKELLGIGFKEIISDPKNIIAIEWADRIQKIMPRGAIWVKFEFVDEKTRKITIEGMKHKT